MLHENFTGKSVESVKQDFFARIFMSNLTSIVAFPTHDAIQENHRNSGLEYKINRTQALAKMRNCGILMLSGIIMSNADDFKDRRLRDNCLSPSHTDRISDCSIVGVHRYKLLYEGLGSQMRYFQPLRFPYFKARQAPANDHVIRQHNELILLLLRRNETQGNDSGSSVHSTHSVRPDKLGRQ